MQTMKLDDVPGYAAQVYGGWVWMTGTTEHRWTKAATREACEAATLEGCKRLGIKSALDL